MYARALPIVFGLVGALVVTIAFFVWRSPGYTTTMRSYNSTTVWSY